MFVVTNGRLITLRGFVAFKFLHCACLLWNLLLVLSSGGLFVGLLFVLCLAGGFGDF